MKSEDIIGIIELGNINIKCIIINLENNKIEILSTSTVASEGIYNDVIINLPKASKVVRSCISKAEKIAKISLKKINVVIEQTDFLCTKFSKHKKINGAKINKEDIEFLLKEAKKQLILNDNKQSIIHIFNYNYIVDGKKFIEEPINVYADFFTHEITFVTVPKNNLKNIIQVFIDCDLEIERIISRTYASGVKLLNREELEFGSTIVDLGSEKTSFGIFKNSAIVHSVTFPIGINHITKDISKVCSLSIIESEKIKNNIDFSFKDNQEIFDENNYLKNLYFSDSNFRKISQKLIFDVVKARLNEIIELLIQQLKTSGFDNKLGMSFFLTGGGSNLINIEKYFIDFFGPNVKKNNNTDNLEKSFSSSLGALKIIKEGWETEAIAETNNKKDEKVSFFAKIFSINR